jgi:hypothetical protein
VAGKKRVPRPAAGRTALRTFRTGAVSDEELNELGAIIFAKP